MISSVIVKNTGYMIADPICSAIISILLLASSYPLLEATGRLLLQRMPDNYISPLQRLVKTVTHMDGVIACRDVHLWQHATTPESITVCTMHVVVKSHVKEEAIREYVGQLVKIRGLCTPGYFALQVSKEHDAQLGSRPPVRASPSKADGDVAVLLS